jgi:ABC-type polysaccharide/polyol phosphate export permease
MTGYFAEIWRLRYFWMALVRNDLRNRYRRSVIGIGWSLLQPIAMTIILCIVFGGMWKLDVRTFAPYLLSGLTFWGFLSAAVIQGCHCFFQGESYIRQCPAPLAIYPLRTTLGAGFHFLIGFAVAILLVWCVNGFSNLSVLPVLIPTFLLLFVIGWSLAVCTGIANVMFQDSQHLIDVGLQILFYVTPIFWLPEQLSANRPCLTWFVDMNPLAALLDLLRQPLLYGQLPSSWSVGMGTLTALALVVAATLGLRRFEKRMIFYL